MPEPRARWTLKLHQPIIVGFRFLELDRQEVIDTLTVEYLRSGEEGMSAEDILSTWKMIDWQRSDPMLMEQFEACDIRSAVIRAQADAMARAEAYCGYEKLCIKEGYFSGHDDLMRRGREYLSSIGGGELSAIGTEA